MATNKKTVPTVKDRNWHFIHETLNRPLPYRAELFKKYGNIIAKPFHGSELFMINHPGFAEHILYKNQDNYRKLPAIIKLVSPLLGRTSILLTNDIKQHDRDREIVTPAFQNDLYFDKYTHTIVNNTATVFDNLLEGLKEKEPKLIPLYQIISELTQKNVEETLFTDLGVDSQKVTELVLRGISLMHKSHYPLYKILLKLPTPFRRRHQAFLEEVGAITNKMIQHRCQSGKRYDDLLERLIRVAENTKNEISVNDNLSTMFSAGQLTTTSSVCWTLIALSLYPIIEREVSNELKTVLNDRLPEFQDLEAMVYTKAVLSEVLRYWPPVTSPVTRQAIDDDEIMGYTIPKGQAFSLSFYHIHHNKEFWENPEGFDPKRFLDNPWGQDYQYAYLPFGSGKRGCLGKHYALMHILLQVTTILQKARLYVPESNIPQAVPIISGLAKPNVTEMWVEKK